MTMTYIRAIIPMVMRNHFNGVYIYTSLQVKAVFNFIYLFRLKSIHYIITIISIEQFMPVVRGFDWFDRTPSARTWVAFSEPACVSLHVIACEMRVHAKYASFYTVIYSNF